MCQPTLTTETIVAFKKELRWYRHCYITLKGPIPSTLVVLFTS